MRKVWSVASLILGLVFFAVFIVLACAAYYFTAGVFVTARLAGLYAVLGLLGALAVVFRGYLFALLFYLGCALGWTTGRYVSTLEGAFAPTAGVITAFFLIGCFALVGLALEIRRFKRRRKKAEQKLSERMAEEQQAAVSASADLSAEQQK